MGVYSRKQIKQALSLTLNSDLMKQSDFPETGNAVLSVTGQLFWVCSCMYLKM